MSETQTTIHSWINETFPGTDPESPRKSIRALEEMVELCLASGASCDEIMESVARIIFENRGPNFGQDITFDEVKSRHFPEPDKIAAEAADVLIVLYGLAGMRGIDLHAEVDRKMKINRSRVWHALGDGTGYHIKKS